jgi:hypothetical protein
MTGPAEGCTKDPSCLFFSPSARKLCFGGAKEVMAGAPEGCTADPTIFLSPSARKVRFGAGELGVVASIGVVGAWILAAGSADGLLAASAAAWETAEA